MQKLAFLCLLFLFGCGDAAEDGALTHSPEKVTLGFFKAIYVDKDVNEAKQYVSEPLQELLEHYYIAASVQRHMLNLSMTDVEMEIDDVDIDFFRKLSDKVTVVIKLKGLKAGQFWIDDRSLRLHKRGKNWVIVEILPEKRQVNG
ncbi:hypothetical protein [Shewanella salipaludis]|uniref:Lipoprotein n=1 Tax=Shewanella salipaludis TaxID=2723052 RepID=A0A972JNF0_9GAMM|nr:hypothetical protein [Shewanella salipaludis]NMH66111.1 hypothetical protein [Shewanella salipaludis]